MLRSSVAADGKRWETKRRFRGNTTFRSKKEQRIARSFRVPVPLGLQKHGTCGSRGQRRAYIHAALHKPLGLPLEVNFHNPPFSANTPRAH